MLSVCSSKVICTLCCAKITIMLSDKSRAINGLHKITLKKAFLQSFIYQYVTLCCVCFCTFHLVSQCCALDRLLRPQSDSVCSLCTAASKLSISDSYCCLNPRWQMKLVIFIFHSCGAQSRELQWDLKTHHWYEEAPWGLRGDPEMRNKKHFTGFIEAEDFFFGYVPHMFFHFYLSFDCLF